MYLCQGGRRGAERRQRFQTIPFVWFHKWWWLRHNTGFLWKRLKAEVKGHPKITILSSFLRPHVYLNLYEFLYSTKEDICINDGKHTADGIYWLYSICYTYYGRQWIPSTMCFPFRFSKWWQIFVIFGWSVPIKHMLPSSPLLKFIDCNWNEINKMKTTDGFKTMSTRERAFFSEHQYNQSQRWENYSQVSKVFS